MYIIYIGFSFLINCAPLKNGMYCMLGNILNTMIKTMVGQHFDHDQPLITMVGNVCFGEHG